MTRSQQLLERATAVIPGGVNSPVRAFSAVGGAPLFVASGEGPWIEDEDGARYLDLVGSWGPLIVGHCHPAVVRAAMDAVRAGSSFGAPTAGEVELAEHLVNRLPWLEQVRLCSSGTEATMHAIRLARGFTGRDRILKMDGCYHGAHDAMLVKAGSGVATFAVPGSPGVPAATADLTSVVPFNDLPAVERMLLAHPAEFAAIILEPVAGNMGCIAPQPGYLRGLRDLADEHGALLIADEVMCGFRAGPQGAQGRYAVHADLTCMGKVVGGGYPLAAFGGRRAVMARLAPAGPVYQAGTLSGNPVAVAAGLATLRLLDDGAFAKLEALGARLEEGLTEGLHALGCSITRVGSMFTVFFRGVAPTRMDEVRECDMETFGAFFRGALERGIYLPPSQYEAAFLNLALTDDHVDRIAQALLDAAAEARQA
jgi:glutamate-1-semialdehyde 2,1-aminomutase